MPGACSGAARIVSIGRAGAFEHRGQPRHFGRDVVDALAQQRVLDPLGRPGRFRLALHRGELALQLGAILARALELAFGHRLFGAQRFGGARVAALDGAELLAQIGLDAPRRVHIHAQLVALALAVGEHARLLGQPHLHVGDAAAHDLGFAGLRRELALELADAGAEVLHVAALLGEFLGGFLVRLPSRARSAPRCP